MYDEVQMLVALFLGIGLVLVVFIGAILVFTFVAYLKFDGLVSPVIFLCTANQWVLPCNMLSSNLV